VAYATEPAHMLNSSANENSPTILKWFTTAVTPAPLFRERIDMEAFSHFVSAFQRGILDHVLAHRATGAHLQVACALCPAARLVLEVQSRPVDFDLAYCQGMVDDLRSLNAPPIQHGPILFVVQLCFPEADPDLLGRSPFLLPFSSRFPRGLNSYDEVILRLAGLDPAACLKPEEGMKRGKPGERGAMRPGWWPRLKVWIRGGREAYQVLLTRVDDPAEGEEPPDPDVFLENGREGSSDTTIDELSDQILRSPGRGRLRGLRGLRYRQEGKVEEAIADFSSYIALHPEHAWGYSLRGETHVLAERIGPALADFDRALSLDPENVMALQGRAIVYSDLGAWDRAEADFAKAIEVEPFRPANRMYRARLRIARSSWDCALEDLDATILLDPHHEEAFALRAYVQQVSTDPDDRTDDWFSAALSDLGNAIRLNPDWPAHYLQRAGIHLMKDDPERAIADCDRALRIDPENANALGLRGLGLEQRDPQRCLQDCTAAIERGSTCPEVFICRARLLSKQGEIDQAMESVDRALEISPDHSFGLTVRGEILLQRGEIDSAMEEFEAALRGNPGHLEAYMGRGLARRARDDDLGAMEDFEEVLRRNPAFVWAHHYRGEILAKQGNRDEALKCFEECIRLAPDFVLPYFLRANLRQEVADTGGALEDLNTVVRLAPDYGPAYFNRGHLLLGKGDRDAALRDFDRLIKLCPSLGVAYSGRGRAWIQIGEFGRAEEDYREAIHLAPGSAEFFILDRLLVEAAYYCQKGDFCEGIEKASEAIELKADFWPAYHQRGSAYWYLERFASAVEDFTRVLELAGESQAGLSCRGQVFAEMGEFRPAIADLDRALELARDVRDPAATAYPLSGRGLARIGLGQYEEASRDLEESLRLCPENAWALYNLGLLREKQGNLKEATAALRRSLEAGKPPLPSVKRRRAKELLSRLESLPAT
jgi:tetratricopeptide (TPR) repeat protein